MSICLTGAFIPLKALTVICLRRPVSGSSMREESSTSASVSVVLLKLSGSKLTVKVPTIHCAETIGEVLDQTGSPQGFQRR